MSKAQNILDNSYNALNEFIAFAEGRQGGRENPDGDCDEILKGRIKVDWSMDF